MAPSYRFNDEFDEDVSIDFGDPIGQRFVDSLFNNDRIVWETRMDAKLRNTIGQIDENGRNRHRSEPNNIYLGQDLVIWADLKRYTFGAPTTIGRGDSRPSWLGFDYEFPTNDDGVFFHEDYLPTVVMQLNNEQGVQYPKLTLVMERIRNTLVRFSVHQLETGSHINNNDHFWVSVFAIGVKGEFFSDEVDAVITGPEYSEELPPIDPLPDDETPTPDPTPTDPPPEEEEEESSVVTSFLDYNLSAVIAQVTEYVYEDEIQLDAPVAWWKMDATSQGAGQLEDYGSGSDSDMDVNGPVLGEPSLVAGGGDSMRFRAGVFTDYCARAGTPAELQISGAFTVEAWFQYPSGETSLGTIFCERYGDGDVRYMLSHWNGSADTLKPSFGWLNGFGAPDLAVSPDDLTADEPHHIVGVYTGSELRIYVDGVLKDTTTPATAQPGGTGNIQIGLRWDNVVPNEFLTGTVQHVAFYSGALSESRIITHYQAGTGQDIISGISFTEHGLDIMKKKTRTKTYQIQALLQEEGVELPVREAEVDAMLQSVLTGPQQFKISGIHGAGFQNAFAVSPDGTTLLMAGDVSSIHVSNDDGISWRPAFKGSPMKGIASVVFHPTDSNKAWTLAAGVGFSRTTNAKGLCTWQRMANVPVKSGNISEGGLPVRHPRSVGELICFGGTALNGSDLWMYAASFSSGVYRSADGGATATRIVGTADSSIYLRGIATDKINNKTLYAGAAASTAGTGGLYRVTNANGGTAQNATAPAWSKMASPFNGVEEVATVAIDGNSIVYVVGSQAGSDGVWKATNPTGSSSGEWTRLGVGTLPTNAAWCSISVSGNTVYIGTATSVDAGATYHHIYKSTNGGSTWTLLTNSASTIYNQMGGPPGFGGSTEQNEEGWPLTPPNIAGTATVLTDPNPNAAWTPSLDNNTDYILRVPTTRTKGISIVGGRDVIIGGYESGGNLVLEGFTINASTGVSAMVSINDDNGGSPDGRVVYIHAPNLDGNGEECDAFKTGSPSNGAEHTILKIKNARVDDLTGTTPTVHADVVQLSGGVKELWIENMYADSNYAGLQLQQEMAVVASSDRTISGFTRSGTKATATTTAAHGLSVGNWVGIWNCPTAAYNGGFKVESTPTSTTFTYDLDDDAPATPVSGGGAKMVEMEVQYTVGDIHIKNYFFRGLTNPSGVPSAALQMMRFGGRSANADGPTGFERQREDQTNIVTDSWTGTAEFINVYGLPVSGNGANFVKPPAISSTYSKARGVLSNGIIKFPNWTAVTGQVNIGTPPGGEYVLDNGTINVPATSTSSGSLTSETGEPWWVYTDAPYNRIGLGGSWVASQIRHNPTAPNKLYAAGRSGAWVTRNTAAVNPAWYPIVKGLGATINTQVMSDPQRPQRVYWSNVDYMILASDDFGKTIDINRAPAPGASSGAVYGMAMDLGTNPSTLVVGVADRDDNKGGGVYYNTSGIGGSWVDMGFLAAAGGPRPYGVATRRIGGTRYVLVSAVGSGIWLHNGTSWSRKLTTGAGFAPNGTAQPKHIHTIWPSQNLAYAFDPQSGVWRGTTTSTTLDTWRLIAPFSSGARGTAYIATVPGDTSKVIVSATTGLFRLDNASTGTAVGNGVTKVQITNMPGPGPICFDTSNRLLVWKDGPDPKLYRTANTASATPTWADIGDAFFESWGQWSQWIDATSPGWIFMAGDGIGAIRGQIS